MNNKLIDASADTIYLCMYRIATLVFSVDDKKIVMNGTNVLSVEKLDNFDFNLRSIIKLRLNVDLRQKIWIINNKTKVKCKFELDKFGMDNEVEGDNVGDQNVWNTEFSVFLNDDDASIDTESLEGVLDNNEGEFKMNDIENRNYFTDQQVFEVYLYNTALLNASRKAVNKIYTSATMAKAAGHILTISGHKNVLMSPMENGSAYSELLIPNLPAYKALAYLDQYYGFYKRGASIYYDVDGLYIINPNGKATAVKKNEWPEVNFIVTQQVNSMPGNGMIRKEKQKCFYINVPEENVSAQRPTDTKKLQFGENIKLVTTNDIAVSNSGKGGNAYQAYQRSDDNKFASSIIQARMFENDSIIYIAGDSLDMNAFTINKTYHLTFEDSNKQKKYGKFNYRIAYAHHYLSMESHNYLKSSHQIVLKKCSEN